MINAAFLVLSQNSICNTHVSLFVGQLSSWHNGMLFLPLGFKSHKGTFLAHRDKAQGVGSPTLMECWLLLSQKFMVYLAYGPLDILLVL